MVNSGKDPRLKDLERWLKSACHDQNHLTLKELFREAEGKGMNLIICLENITGEGKLTDKIEILKNMIEIHEEDGTGFA
ncbi:MAG: hypothetical protein ISR98_02085 [Parcubacteria group bacterium]|nr:hypothetical protein [Parcubacteria group bacterium]